MLKLTADNYFSQQAQMEYMSVSQFKEFDKCQYRAMADLKGEYERPLTTALLVGSYVDAWFEGKLEEFKILHPELYTRGGELKSEYRKANEIIERVSRDNMFMNYMSGKKQVIMTGVIDDIPIKIKVDSLCDNKIVDLKVVKDFAPIYVPGQGRLSFVEAWGYDLQAAIYQEIVRQNIGEKLPFYIAAATKEPTTDIAIIEIPQELMDYELERFSGEAMYFDGIKKGLFEPERCGKCDHCKNTKVLTEVMSLEDLNDECSGN